MSKEDIKKNIIKTALFLVGIIILLVGNYFNDQYKEKHGIDRSSGATQMYE